MITYKCMYCGKTSLTEKPLCPNCHQPGKYEKIGTDDGNLPGNCNLGVVQNAGPIIIYKCVYCGKQGTTKETLCPKCHQPGKYEVIKIEVAEKPIKGNSGVAGETELTKTERQNEGVGQQKAYGECFKFCPNCGTKIENEQSSFCFSCGFSLKGIAPAGNPTPTKLVTRNRLWTDEASKRKLPPDLTPVIEEAKEQGGPVYYDLREYKVKCEYCYLVFSYYDNNLGYRAWYSHGFVSCPSCGRPLRHHGVELLQKIHHLLVFPDGKILEKDE